MLEPSLPTPSLGRACWQFASAHRRPGPEDRSATRAALDAALRVGHGAAAGWTLEFLGGPEASVRLLTDDAPSERWVERSVLRAYGAPQWHRRAAAPSAPASVRWSARRRGLPGLSSAPTSELGQLAAALTGALQHGGGSARLSIALRPAPPPRFRWLDLFGPATLPARPSSSGRPTAGAGGGPDRAPPASPLLWSAAVDLWWSAAREAPVTAPPVGAVVSAWTSLDGQPLLLRTVPIRAAPEHRSLLSLPELLSLLPYGGEGIGEGPSPNGPPGGIPIGRSRSGSVVALPVEPGEGRHFAILGETGMGKSSLLTAVGVRAARLGGLLMLDPVGETAAALREELRGLGREVLWVAPDAPGGGLNALAGISSALPTDAVRAERELDALVHALRRVRRGRFADGSYWGPRLEEMLGRALRAAATVPGGTLEDAYALLAGAGAGRRVVPAESAPEVRELWARVRDRPEDADGTLRLLHEVVRNPSLLRLLCARPAELSMEQLVAPRRVVLVSGSASRVGEATARYLLATYLALAWSELLARPGRPKTFVLLDEAQWFGHEALGEMLRLARRCNVHVGLATQSLGSLSEEVQESVRTNVADLVAFRGSVEESRGGARGSLAVPFDALVGLRRGEAVAVLGKGERRQWLRTARLPVRSASQGPGPGGPASTPDVTPTELPLDDATAGVGGDASLPAEVAGAGPLAEDAGPGQLVAIDVAALRAVAGEQGVRALGSRLGRLGAIVRSERRASGPVWWVRAETLADPDVPGAERLLRPSSGAAQRL